MSAQSCAATSAHYWEQRSRRFAARGAGLAAVCSYGMPELYNRAIQYSQRLALAPHLRVPAGTRVLDVGCGIGRWSRLLAARGRLDDCFARLDRCGADPELVVLCKRCLSPDKADRPADAGELAKAVAYLRAVADERARQAELDRVKAEAEAKEQRKRRRVQLAFAAAVGVLLVGGGAVELDHRVDRGAAEQLLLVFELRSDRVEHLDRRADDLGADPVAGEQDNFGRHQARDGTRS